MKAVKKSIAGPTHLVQYVAANPVQTWAQFRGDKNQRKQTQDQLFLDQRGLCAYCEINLLVDPLNAQANDFRVEHFHPQTPHAPPPNWGLAWTNLLACCHGGSSKNVIDPARFNPADLSCDVPKKNFNWVGVILDPLLIPPLEMLFSYVSNGIDAGEINVDTDRCPEGLKAEAQNSIDKLNLNATRLKLARTAAIDEMNVKLHFEITQGKSQNPAIALATVFLNPLEPQWNAFPTCTRWVLGASACNYLKNNNFIG